MLTTAGTFNFSATVTNAASATATQAFVITISQPPLTVTTTSLSTAKEGVAYTATLIASGGTAPYSWAISSGNLPFGITLQGGGYLTGTPAKGTLGTYTFTVTVTDSSSTPLAGQGSLYLTVEKGGYTVTVVIGSGLKSGTTRVLSGTTLVATLAGGGSTTLSFDLGTTPQISVDTTVQNPSDTGIRYRAEESKITVSELIPSVTFNYVAEYAIELKTDPSTIGSQTGSGWYKEGYVLRNTAQSEIADAANPGIQYRFASWKLPTGETVSNRDLALTVNAAGTCTANYDTYYKLTLSSPYGDTNISNWYKAGNTAEWSVKNAQVSMPGFFGIFGGKLNAVNPTGSVVMDAPKTMTVSWEPDYTLPFILIPLALLVLVFGAYGIYLLLHGPRTKPQFQGPPQPPPQWARPVPPPPPPQPAVPPPWYRPIPPPPPQTTVVMIGGDNNKPKIGPPTTKEQLMEKFGELLEKYGDELKGSGQSPGLPKIGIAPGASKPPAAELPSPVAGEEKSSTDEFGTLCNFKSKRLLRPVTTKWKKLATKDTLLESGGKETGDGISGTLIVWARDIYQEWEIVTCELPLGHEGSHDRSIIETVYSLLNGITEVKVYKPEEELVPPKPHYTDSMPQIDVESCEIVTTDKLPPATTT
ncbi:MAG TPA: hypothetical protein DCX22_02975 [Dehalococcoidia bacterium]|nr:hypothetical protein [Dehalococcoidia bacterium]